MGPEVSHNRVIWALERWLREDFLLGGRYLSTLRLGDPSRTQTGGADVHPTRGATNEGTDALDIWVPTTLGSTV